MEYTRRMKYDAAVALRMINNNNIRGAHGWCEFRDLGGALAVTSDAPMLDVNALIDFNIDERSVENVLDVGFALLRAFDREPAARITPLDRPPSLAEHLAGRGLRPLERRSWMTFPEAAAAPRSSDAVEVRVAGPDDAATFAAVHGAGESWLRRLSLSTTLTAMQEDGNTFYVGYVDGQPAGVCQLLSDSSAAGVYAVTTAAKFRGKGVGSTLVARAIADARRAHCDVVFVNTVSDSAEEQMYAHLGFERMFESVLWTTPTPAA